MGRYQYRGTLDCTLVSYITAELEKALKTLSQHEGQERENSDWIFYHNGANLQPRDVVDLMKCATTIWLLSDNGCIYPR